MKDLNTPTSDTYNAILHAYDFFNQALFENKLPQVIITYHRQRRIMGYASIERWVNSKQEYIDELSVNPEYFAKYPLVEICQTLCHEMVHIWQAHFGKPSRRGYHNVQWSKKMESLGLMPSSTGKPGGNKTGEIMMDYAYIDGRFMKNCQELINSGFNLPWVDRYPVFRLEVPVLAFTLSGTPIELNKKCLPKKMLIAARSALPDQSEIVNDLVSEDIETNEVGNPLIDPIITETEPYQMLSSKPASKSGRRKYACKSCSILVWGKPGLKLGCLDCNLQLQVVD